MHSSQHYRLLALLLTIVMSFQIIVMPNQSTFAEATATDIRQESDVPALRENVLTVLAFTSDIHNTSGNTAANRLGRWLDTMADSDHFGKKPDVMAFGGDMAGANAAGYWDLTQADMNILTDRDVTGAYTTGNHEISYGGDFSFSSYQSGAYSSTETKGQFQISKEAAVGSNYRIYCLGSRSGRSDYSNSIDDLVTYLNNVGNDKPIFIITHFPLHAFGSRVTTGASDVVDVLNNAVVDNGQKIVFLWGHNHTESDTYYDYIYRAGDTIPTGTNNTNRKTIRFYYGAAGCMSDREYGTGSASVKGKGLIVTINSSNQLSFAYYDENGNNVTEGGTFTEQDSIEVTGVTVNTSVTVDVGREVQLTANVSPDNATNKAVRWSSDNTSVATVDEKGLVQGVSEGSAIITVTTVDGSYSASCEVTVTLNDDPYMENIVNITPTTENPEEYITIDTGDLLTINVTNGSSSNSYNFTATLDNSGIAQIQGNTTINIAAGNNGQFIVEGVSAGTTDITIQNNPSYSQYLRKGIIHLTVEDSGSTPIDPSLEETVTYHLTTALKDGKKYIITNGNSGNVYVLSTEANGSRILKGIAAAVTDNKITLSSSDAVVSSFTAELKNDITEGFWLKNEEQYLSVNNASGLRMVDSSEQNSSSNSVKCWHYKAEGKDLLWNFKDTSTSDGYTDASQSYKYYLECSNGIFTDGHVSNKSLVNSINLPKMYIFEEMTDQEQDHIAPAFTVHSLVLSGKIGVNFFMDLPTIDGVDYTDSRMEFTVNGKTTTASFDPDFKNSTKDYYGFTCHVNSIQMAETITAVFRYGDDQTVTETYSIKQYLESLDAKADSFDETTVSLFHALADYGHYVQPFLSDANGWVISTDYAEMDKYYTTGYTISEVTSAVAGYAISRVNSNPDVEKITYTLSLDSGTDIRVYFKPVADYSGSFAVTVDGNTWNAVKQTDGRYLVTIPGISAHLLGTTYTVVATTDAGSATVKVSALSYVQELLETYTDSRYQNAAASIYYYYAAAQAYKENH